MDPTRYNSYIAQYPQRRSITPTYHNGTMAKDAKTSKVVTMRFITSLAASCTSHLVRLLNSVDFLSEI
ncbi:predicted protein [Sclerotinia sclerotiorum 1980 UF-70]|uniref:Uncharacterized protein n=1 Tax=Sclerotinia sclerotiorum (strain ATCC 18683 / 1980 / Ss-1) TaxID=665079 RepID=A7EUM3_SCLS1|nr:predicted protein [Sclerotinia sclerotiorum 1980 UF-70]EDN93165.1 predicted protein [Sclerotinia sclerotiorum 1980 UF-70]